MDAEDQIVAVFKSTEPKDVAKACELLDAEGIPFDIVNSQIGSIRMPCTTSIIVVPSEKAKAALRRISKIPSELIVDLPDETQGNDAMIWYQRIMLVILFAIIIICIIITLMSAVE